MSTLPSLFKSPPAQPSDVFLFLTVERPIKKSTPLLCGLVGPPTIETACSVYAPVAKDDASRMYWYCPLWSETARYVLGNCLLEIEICEFGVAYPESVSVSVPCTAILSAESVGATRIPVIFTTDLPLRTNGNTFDAETTPFGSLAYT